MAFNLADRDGGLAEPRRAVIGQGREELILTAPARLFPLTDQPAIVGKRRSRSELNPGEITVGRIDHDAVLVTYDDAWD